MEWYVRLQTHNRRQQQQQQHANIHAKEIRKYGSVCMYLSKKNQMRPNIYNRVPKEAAKIRKIVRILQNFIMCV